MQYIWCCVTGFFHFTFSGFIQVVAELYSFSWPIHFVDVLHFMYAFIIQWTLLTFKTSMKLIFTFSNNLLVYSHIEPHSSLFR